MKDIGFDLELQDSDQDQLQRILEIYRGDLKSAPMLGVGIADFVDGDDIGDANHLEQVIRKHFGRDGATIKKLSFDKNNINIDATYNG